MVIEDNRHLESSSGHSHPNQFPVAFPMDRLAAFLVDVTILFVTGSLLIAPLQRKIKAAQLVSESEVMFMGLLLVFLVAGILAVIYQTVFVGWRGQTIGKRIFGLKVVDIWSGKNPKWSESFFRSVLWWFDILIGAIPTLGVYSDPLRRTFHDRVSNTIVISLRGRGAKPPEGNEISVVKAIFVAIYLLGFVVVFEETRMMLQALQADESTHLLEMMSPVQCENVTKAMKDWPQEAGLTPSRISVGLAMFAAGLIEEECLNQEAYSEFRNGKNHELAYLARAFVTSDDSGLSDQYLEKVCSVNAESQACRLSEVISLWTEREWDKASEGFSKLLPDSSVFIRTWAIKHYEKIKDYASELKVIDTLWPLEGLSAFLSSHRAISLWGLHRYDEARVAARAAVENLSEEKRLGLAGWMCYHELENSCNTNSVCDFFSQQVQSKSLSFDLYAVTYVKLKECQNEFNAEDLAASSDNEAVINLIEGMEWLHKKDIDKANSSFKEAIDRSEVSSLVAHEARKLLILNTQDEEIVSELMDSWEHFDATQVWNWSSEGEKLAQRLIKDKRYAEALETLSKVLKLDPGNADARKAAVVAAFHENKFKIAQDLLKPLQKETRSPASESEFESVQKKLLGRGHQ